MGLELQVDASGRVSATTSVEQVQKSGSVFSQLSESWMMFRSYKIGMHSAREQSKAGGTCWLFLW